MAVTLGHNQYGKDEIRVVRVFRDTDPHTIVDYNVSVRLVGDFDAAHLEGGQQRGPADRHLQEHGVRVRRATTSSSRSPSRSGGRWPAPSRALQQTIWLMGRAALIAGPGINGLRMSCPNAHHFLYDVERVGIDNPARSSTPTTVRTG